MNSSFTSEFEKFDYAQWLSAVGRDLKLDLQAQEIENKLNTKSLEGVDLRPLRTSSPGIYLDSYPQKSTLFKNIIISKGQSLSDIHQKLQESIDGGVSHFVIELIWPNDLNDLSFLELDANFILQLSNIQMLETVAEKLSDKLFDPKVQIQLDPLAMLQSLEEKNISDVTKKVHEIITQVTSQSSHHSSQSIQISWVVDATKIHNAGASMVQELAYITSVSHELLATKNFGVSDKKVKSKLYFKVATDSLFFSNVAKLRALRFIWQRLLSEYEESWEFEILTTNSLREQTLYDPWVNILRNATSTFSSILGGADKVSCLSYEAIFEQLSDTHCNQSDKVNHKSANKLGDTIARNSMHILFEESHSNSVKDPMAGSYSVEDLTQQLIGGAWQLFLQFEKNSGVLSCIEDFAQEVKAIAQIRYEQIRTRKRVLTGINNFANPKETISSLYHQNSVFEVNKKGDLFPLRRLASEFEQLRMHYETKFNESTLSVYLACYGDPAKLSARINFAKNYFELLGIEVTESVGKNLSHEEHLDQIGESQVVILCALDEDYQEILNTAKDFYGSKKMYLAGKFNHPEIQAIYQGQDVYHVLSELVE